MAESLKVLIVDEDPDGRVAARKAAQRANLGIAGESGFGTQAVSLALQAVPDAVLLAVEEPMARSLETAEALAGALPDTPILIYSSSTDPEAIRRAMVFGARDFLTKPLQGAQLKEAVYRALAQEEQRQLRRAGLAPVVAGRGTLIVVTGAKGGIGKSVAAVNLAVALRAETGKSVALVDADTQFGDVATLLDLSPAMTVSDVLRNLDSFERSTAERYMAHHASGVDVLATPRDEDPWIDCSAQQWNHMADVLAQVYEFVVVDTSGSFDAFVRNCVQGASLTLVVTTGEVSSVRDTASALRRLEGWGVDPTRVRVVFNRGARAAGVGKDEIEKAIGREVFWELPNDKTVPHSVQVGRPVALDPRTSSLGQNVRALARLIAGTKRSLVEQPAGRRGLLQRLITLRGRTNDTDLAPAAEPDPQR